MNQPAAPSTITKQGLITGQHLLIELQNCDAQLLNDHDYLVDVIKKAAIAAHATALNVVSHRFQPQGVTVLALLAESHFSIHTWPEYGYAAVDLFTCGKNMDQQKGIDFLQSALKCQRVSIKILTRGTSNE